MSRFDLTAKGGTLSAHRDFVEYVAKRKGFKETIFQDRKGVIDGLKSRFNQLMYIHRDSQGNLPKTPKTKALLAKSLIAHQAFNTLMGEKFEPDFINYSPLLGDYSRELEEKAQAYSKVHRAVRYKGGYDKAKIEGKKDLIWGNSFMQMGVSFDGNDQPQFIEYSNIPFNEFRNYYGDTDCFRIVDMPIEIYATEYGEEMLNIVSCGGITFNDSSGTLEDSFNDSKDFIQVIYYYDPFRKIYGEIHGGNGHVQEFLEKDKYPFLLPDLRGYAPVKESRYYEPGTDNYFGYGVMDGLIDLAELDTTIVNATARDAVWDASKPTIISSNDPDNLSKKMNKHYRNLARGINTPIIEKDSGLGTKANIQTLAKGVDNGNMQVWDETIISRATRFSSIDFQSLTDFAPTAEQQNIKKAELKKLNTRVLTLNESREMEFAIKEMAFISNIPTKFQNKEIDIIDSASEQFATEDGYKPAKKMKIKDVVKSVKDLDFIISPRLDGVLDDMTIQEIEVAQAGLASVQPGTIAYDKLSEDLFTKNNPKAGLKRTDFSTPSQPAQ